MAEQLKEGDHIRLRQEQSSTGTIDEIYWDHVDGRPTEMATIIWDISGCASDIPTYDLEKTDG